MGSLLTNVNAEILNNFYGFLVHHIYQNPKQAKYDHLKIGS